ncbi:hypothetical protein CWI38_0926p0040 [Hamiltosporidium tvaerminnensis]|uniref:SAP domain-containing protein n=1 Tax=Hamiltosporidium tvaerminnensis TaxID=1176355 RepID=A0A4Q9LTU7_9MICR|nr:hypothetical protein CWI38_0926p0040 [Hamiltosporidium tvaerminnensis]
MSDRLPQDINNIEIPSRGRPRKKEIHLDGLTDEQRMEYFNAKGISPGQLFGDDTGMRDRRTDFNTFDYGGPQPMNNNPQQYPQPYTQPPYSQPYTQPYNSFYPEYPFYQPLNDNPWMNRKKRKNNPLLWQYIKHHQDFYPNILHPSKYSSLDFIQGTDKSQKMYIGTIKRAPPFIEKNNHNSILPLYLNSAHPTEQQHIDEFKKISTNFLNKTVELDYENVTVQQLKAIMKEFGLNHTGKKIDLIDRVKTTITKIEERKRKDKKQSQEIPEDDKDLNFLFF